MTVGDGDGRQLQVNQSQFFFCLISNRSDSSFYLDGNLVVIYALLFILDFLELKATITNCYISE